MHSAGLARAVSSPDQPELCEALRTGTTSGSADVPRCGSGPTVEATTTAHSGQNLQHRIERPSRRHRRAARPLVSGVLFRKAAFGPGLMRVENLRHADALKAFFARFYF